MRKALYLTPLFALCLSATVCAQTVQTLPAGFLTTEGGSNNIYPWGTTTIRAQHCYDSSHVNFSGPVLISRLRIRADGSTTSTWAGGTFANVIVSMSTAKFDYAAQTTTFANNHGTDLAVVHKGNVVVAPQTTAGSIPQKTWYIDIKLATPFRYDPSSGKDLIIDAQIGALTGVTFRSDAVSGTAYKCSRVYNTGSATATTGSVGNNYGIITEISWVPAKGLFSNFTASPTSGPGPLKVQFTDKTFTSSTGGVKGWAWDFDGDNKIDSTLQNPVFTFPKTTWDATYDVTLTTTDGTFPASKITKKAYITVDPSDAFAVNFGSGSTNKPVPTPIGLPANTSIYSAAAGVRGFYFIAPTTFIITGFEAPNEYSPKESDQTVTCYVMAKAPTGAYTPVAADVKFHGTGKANTVLTPTKPIVVTKGQWVGILGACHASTAASLLRNAYATGSYQTTVLGQPITLNRLWMNFDPRVNKGLAVINPSTGSIARVFVHVAGNTTVPTMTTIGVPSLGTTPKLDLQAKIAGAQGGIVLLGAGRLAAPVPTQFGNLLIKPPFFMSLFVMNGTGQVPLPVPSDTTLKGVILDFQGMVYNLTTMTYGTTNGTEWFLGK